MKATRHNGRSGVHGTYNVKHNDRNFDVVNSEHIDEERTVKNIYWDCYQGYYRPDTDKGERLTFSEIEKQFYSEHYGAYVKAQNLRNEEARHKERNRTIDDLLVNKKTCPEESLLQLGNIDGTVPSSLLAEISSEYFDEFDKRFGKHIHIIDWALHMDETTPHIHERHVFDAENQYGEICPQQDKALEELGFELPDPTKGKGRYNNRKMSFDSACRNMFLEICLEHGLEIDMEPVYGGRSYLEKEDYIVMKLKDEKEQLLDTNAELMNENDRLVMKISDVEKLLDDVAENAYEKACGVVTEAVITDTQKTNEKLIDDYEARILEANNPPATKNIVRKVFAGIRNLFARTTQRMLGSIHGSLSDPLIKERNIGKIKERARESIMDKLTRYKEQVALEPRRCKPDKQRDMERGL